MDLSSPGERVKSRSSSSVGSQNRLMTDSFSSNEPWQEGHDDFDPGEVQSANGQVLRGAASLPHIVNGDKTDFVCSKSEPDVGSVELDGAVARTVDDDDVDDDETSVVLRPTSARHNTNLVTVL